VNPRLSIVVTSPALDRLSDLRSLIDSLASQTETRSELIFVAENSVMLLEEVKEYARQKGIEGTFVFNRGTQGLAQGRNLGFKFANAEVIAMIDDDVVLSPNWVEAIFDSFKNPEVVGVTGPAYPLWEEESMAWLPEEFYWLISCTAWHVPRNPSNIRSAWGMNMAFRREAILEAGGFLELSGYHKPMAEDLEFSLRVKFRTGKRIIFNEKAYVWHRVHSYRLSWRYVSERSRHIGTSRYMIKKLYGAPYEKEYDLLLRVLRKLPRRFITAPRESRRVLELVVMVAFNIAVGYLSPLLLRSQENQDFLLAASAKRDRRHADATPPITTADYIQRVR
jgi:GT2 family glycosyltransferase